MIGYRPLFSENYFYSKVLEMLSPSEQKKKIDPSDGLPVMEVGAWSEDKHALIRKFVHASWAARSKWAQRTYIDLFCGPGRISVRNTDQVLDGSPLVAWKQSKLQGGAFTDVIVADLDAESVDACRIRLDSLGAPVQTKCGDVTKTVTDVLQLLRMDGLHLVVLDPFNIGSLDFSVLRSLARLKHVDIILHFSVMDVQRNIENEYRKTGGSLERFAPGWRNHVKVTDMGKEASRNAYLGYWIKIVSELGFNVASKSPLFKNQRTAPLYRLALLYRHRLAEKLWNDVAKSPDQRTLDI